MNPNSPTDKSDSWSLDDLLISSNDGSDRVGRTRPSYEPVSPVAESSPPAEEPGQSQQLTFKDCETSAITSNTRHEVTTEQLGLGLAPVGKRCYGCRRLLPIEAFARMTYRDRPGVEFRNPRCNSCRAAREKGTPSVVHRRKLFEAARCKPCTDCGKEYPLVCMDLDHVRGDKDFNIGSSHMHVKTEVLVAEIEKCEPVCSNCRRMRTAARLAAGTLKRKGGRPPKFLAVATDELKETAPGPRSLWTKYRRSA